MSQRNQVKELYKKLLRLGRSYSHGYEYFRKRCKESFHANRNEDDKSKIEIYLAYGEYVAKELEALYKLETYRDLRRKYYIEKLSIYQKLLTKEAQKKLAEEQQQSGNEVSDEIKKEQTEQTKKADLIHLGKDYPHGFDYFRTRLHRAFIKNKDETDPEKIEKMIGHGNYIIKELEALYMLKKYRTLKRRYYRDQN